MSLKYLTHTHVMIKMTFQHKITNKHAQMNCWELKTQVCDYVFLQLCDMCVLSIICLTFYVILYMCEWFTLHEK